MTDSKRQRGALSAPVAKKRKMHPDQARSKGFVTRDQRLPESPPLNAASSGVGAGGGLMAVVRARYRNAVDLLFGSMPRVLNASCTAVLHPLPATTATDGSRGGSERTERRHPTRRRGREPSRARVSPGDDRGKASDDDETSEDHDQVVPEGAECSRFAGSDDCQSGKGCRCADSLWTSGGIGPELMLRTAEELSERILVLYGKAVDPETSNVDYSSLVHTKDFHEYLLAARKLRYFDPLLLNVVERKAFFLNVYNSLMIHAIAVMLKPRTMFERISMYNTAAYDIGGRAYSLNMIEHGVLRSNRPGNGPFAQVPFADNDARKQCALPTVDPRIHFALNCGARSCPAVRFYEADNLDRTLDGATRAYLQEMEVDSEKRIITLPKLLQWYRVDFSSDGDIDALIKWTLPYLDENKRKRITALLVEKKLATGTFKVEYGGYDWTVNDSSL